MNNFFKATLRLNGLRSLLRPVKNGVISSVNQQRQIARTLWYMSNTNQKDFTKKVEHSQLCSCGCGSKRAAHTKAEKELLEFLTEEILAERKAQKIKAIPSELDGFKASLNGAEVTLTKTVDDENIKISFNVNDSVDTDVEPEVNENMDKPDLGELKSRPSFKVELVKGKTTISLICSYLNSNEQGDGYNDIFGIDEICIYEGEWNANTYSVSGDVLDSYLYDLLMNYMEEKGISNEFVEKLSKYSTAYEHASYIGMLEGLSKFVSGK